ncbi:MAG: hypothetical protein WA194_04285 [Patescibacteria group bacterium]
MATDSRKTYSRLALATCAAMVTGYAVGYAAWVNMPAVHSGDVLSSTGWNDLVGNVNAVNGKIGTLTAGKSCTSDGSKIDCSDPAKQSVTFVDAATYNFTTAWSLGPSFPATGTFKAGSKVRLSYLIPMRNDSTSWG